MRIIINGSTKEIAELFNAIQQENKKIITFGDILDGVPELNAPDENKSHDAAIDQTPAVVAVLSERPAEDFLGKSRT